MIIKICLKKGDGCFCSTDGSFGSCCFEANIKILGRDCDGMNANTYS